MFRLDINLKLCLVEWILGRMEEKKMSENKERKLFGGCLVGREREEKKMVGFGVFSLRPPKSCLPKMERKLLRGVWFIYGPKCPCALAYGFLFSTFSFFLFSLDVAFSFLFFFIYFLTRSDFFRWFLLFLINLDNCFSFLVTFLF